jgi:AAA domain
VLPGDLSELRECVRSVQARLVVIDPIVAAIDVSFDAHKDQHVRSVLAEIAALAEQEDLAVAMVGHLNKAPSSEAYIRVANSVAFWNASRSVVLVTEDPDEPESHRLIAQRKANCSRLAPIQRHRIEEIVLPDTVDHLTGEQIETSRMVFIEYADDVDGDDLLGPRSRGGKEDRAVEFLAEALADDDWHDSVGLKKLAGATGISERTVQRASQDLEVEHDRRGFPSSTWWRLPQSRQGLSHTDGASGSSIEIPANKHIGGGTSPVMPNISEKARLARLAWLARSTPRTRTFRASVTPVSRSFSKSVCGPVISPSERWSSGFASTR